MHLLDRYMQAVGGAPLLSAEEEIQLALLARSGEAAARDRMILSNMRLVVKIAYDYAHMGVPLLDLISEGNLGLIKAVDRFSPHRGGRLATYAAWWIRQNIKKALADQSKLIRLPLHIVDKIAKLRHLTADLTAKLGREPTLSEISRASHLSQKRISQLRELLSSTVSLETSPRSESAAPLEDTLSDERSESPLAMLLQKTAAERIGVALSNMDEREAIVLRYRYGIGGALPLTLNEIGARLGLTRERVRQIESEARSRLRHLLLGDDAPLSKKEVEAQARERNRVEVLREFMLEKGLIK